MLRGRGAPEAPAGVSGVSVKQGTNLKVLGARPTVVVCGEFLYLGALFNSGSELGCIADCWVLVLSFIFLL